MRLVRHVKGWVKQQLYSNKIVEAATVRVFFRPTTIIILCVIASCQSIFRICFPFQNLLQQFFTSYFKYLLNFHAWWDVSIHNDLVKIEMLLSQYFHYIFSKTLYNIKRRKKVKSNFIQLNRFYYYTLSIFNQYMKYHKNLVKCYRYTMHKFIHLIIEYYYVQ